MLKIKLKNEDIEKVPSNIGTVTKETFNPEKITHYNLYEDDSTEGLLFFLFEVFDNDIINNKNIVIDCNDDDQIKMETNVKLDENIYFNLPYITEDIKLNSNADYDKNNYNNSIE